jgi:hypothetical protein
LIIKLNSQKFTRCPKGVLVSWSVSMGSGTETAQQPFFGMLSVRFLIEHYAQRSETDLVSSAEILHFIEARTARIGNRLRCSRAVRSEGPGTSRSTSSPNVNFSQ